MYEEQLSEWFVYTYISWEGEVVGAVGITVGSTYSQAVFSPMQMRSFTDSHLNHLATR